MVVLAGWEDGPCDSEIQADVAHRQISVRKMTLLKPDIPRDVYVSFAYLIAYGLRSLLTLPRYPFRRCIIILFRTGESISHAQYAH